MMKATDRLLGEGIAKLLRCSGHGSEEGSGALVGAQNLP